MLCFKKVYYINQLVHYVHTAMQMDDFYPHHLSLLVRQGNWNS